ncbi:MAG: hypothetical protein Q7T53_07075 [Deltaproteobacteria bacterium]|nr:hypothetical protein [Deltaproteobacteria bacterium]
MKLSKSQRETFLKYLLETYKFNLGGLVIGSIIASDKIKPASLFVGLLFSLLCFIAAMLLSKEDN